jgi:hypothetical protein
MNRISSSGPLYITAEDSSAITGTASETQFSHTYILPANHMVYLRTIKVKAMVRVTVQNGTTDLTLRGRFGTTDIVESIAIVDPAAEDVFILDFWVTSRIAPDASASVVGGGFVMDVLNNALVTSTSLANGSTLATNGALTINITAEWAAANSSSCFLETFTVLYE